jgi:hypothetical protein
MNNRNLLIAAFGLFVSISAFAGVENGPTVTRVVNQVIPDDNNDWDDLSTEVVLVRNNKTESAQELEAVEALNKMLAESKNDTVWLSYVEPFLFEGKEFDVSSDYIGEAIES